MTRKRSLIIKVILVVITTSVIIVLPSVHNYSVYAGRPGVDMMELYFAIATELIFSNLFYIIYPFALGLFNAKHTIHLADNFRIKLSALLISALLGGIIEVFCYPDEEGPLPLRLLSVTLIFFLMYFVGAILNLFIYGKKVFASTKVSTNIA